jgi:hypothetical protein
MFRFIYLFYLFIFYFYKKWPVKLSITINKETHSLIINLFFYSDSSLSHRHSNQFNNNKSKKAKVHRLMKPPANK